MNFKKIILFVSILLMVGCNTDKIPAAIDGPDEVRCKNAPNVILDNDNYDPDWLVTLVTGLTLDRDCKINLIGVMINGIDTHNKAGLMYNTVITYYGVSDRIPIGINHHYQMRTTPTKATADAPYIDPDFKGNQKRITDFPSDGLLDSERPDVQTTLCALLEKHDNIIYVTGGHLQNLQALIETKECNGPELIRKKIKRFIFGTGYSKETEGKAEMNFSEGRYDTTAASIAANSVFNSGLDAEVPFWFPHDGFDRSSTSCRIGDQYKDLVHTTSPMAFVYAIDTYGTWGDHCIGDSEVLLEAANMSIEENIVTPEREVCIELNSENAIIFINEDKHCNHYIRSINSGGELKIVDILNQLLNK